MLQVRKEGLLEDTETSPTMRETHSPYHGSLVGYLDGVPMGEGEGDEMGVNGRDLDRMSGITIPIILLKRIDRGEFIEDEFNI